MPERWASESACRDILLYQAGADLLLTLIAVWGLASIDLGLMGLVGFVAFAVAGITGVISNLRKTIGNRQADAKSPAPTWLERRVESDLRRSLPKDFGKTLRR